MTLEEVVQHAENGNISAMIALGNHYMQQNTGEGISDAEKWYEMAAQQGDLYAIHMTVLCKKILAYAGLQIAEHDEFSTDFLVQDWKEVYEWARKEVQLITEEGLGNVKLDLDDVRKNLADATYYLALSCYWVGQHMEAKALLQGCTDDRSRILYGAVLVQLAERDRDLSDTLEYLYSLVDNAVYAAASKARFEEDVYTLAACHIAAIFRTYGKQIESAVSVLNFVLDAVKDENNKKMLRDELGHYQKKLFGGYRYVE